MKKKIDQVYEYVERTILAGTNGNGIHTEEVAAALSMQRTNVSTLLNQLVNQGKLVKTGSRPVAYTLAGDEGGINESVLDGMVGRNGSLKKAVDTLEAAIAYPGEKIRMMMVSDAGNEHEYIAVKLRDYAVDKGIFDKNAPYVAVNCIHYLKNVNVLDEKLFGMNDMKESAFVHAENGLLFIRNVQYMTAEQQARLNEFIEYGLVYNEDHSRYIQCRNVSLLLSAPLDQLPEAFAELRQITIPSLQARPFGERFELINGMFRNEAKNAGLPLGVSTRAFSALLMSDDIKNVRQLDGEIKAACAAAYVRALNDHQDEMLVMVNDFSIEVRKGLLNMKNHSEYTSILKNTNGDILYYDASGIKVPSDHMYTEIRRRIDEMTSHGINVKTIDELSGAFVPHKMDIAGSISAGKDNELTTIVDRYIVAVVQICLSEYEKRNHKKLDSSVLNRLCLQIYALQNHQGAQELSDAETKGIVEAHPAEFETCLYITSCLNYMDLMTGNLSINEIAMMARTLLDEHDQSEKHPVLLYAMHGDHTASSLAEVTNALTHLNNAYAFDMKLSYSGQEAMTVLKDKLSEIDQGQGVIVIYDMGSIADMLNTIMEETKINLRVINTPVTLYGLDVAWKSYEQGDIDDVYNDIRTMMRNYSPETEKKRELIITLCETGQGGAEELKRYIDEYSSLGIKTTALAISNKSELLQRVTDLQKIYNIRAFIGTYDPKLFGIPFISINRVFHTSHEHLDQVLMFEPIEDKMQDYAQVYQMLAESLHYTSISRLKSTLPEIVDNLSESYHLNDNQKDGLFVHLACSVERLLSGDEEKPVVDEEQKKKVMRLNEDYGIVSRQVRKLEKAFNVIFDDNEIAVIIMILRKI